MNRLTVCIIAASVTASPVWAQSALSTAPLAIQEHYSGMINAADLNLKYCDGESYSYFGLIKHEKTCVLISSPCMGQCCEQSVADYYGNDDDPRWTGAWRIPAGYKYAGWECKPFGETSAGLALSGLPGVRGGR